LEQQVLAAVLQDRAAFESLASFNFDPSDFSPEGEIIYGLAKDYYSTDKEASKCDPDILESRARREIKSNKQADIVSQGMHSLCKLDISALNIQREAISVKQATLGNKIASRLAQGKPDQSIKEWMNEYIELSERHNLVQGSEGEEEFVGTKATDLTKSSFSKEGLIPLYPLVLNEAIDGGIRGGHHILVFAPTEGFKTGFALNACYGFLKHGLRVCYLSNEDPPPDILMRMMTRLTGMTKYEIIDNPVHADSLLSRRNWDKFIFCSLAPGNFSQIHKLLDKYEPQVLILDQLRNIDVGVDQRTQSLEKAATEARNTAKRYAIPVISITQAADSASGKTRLNRGDVDGSNVGIPGTTDLMIGIGATPEMEERNMIALSLVKNKLAGTHHSIQVSIDPFTSRIVE
jgi:KaiC/GvpD/RAD55 family RecA-like ATPase